MKYITKQDEQDLIPNSIDIKLAESKGLATNGQLTEEYFTLQSIYYNILEQYIDTLINFEEIEKSLEQNNIRKVSESEKDIYQYLSNHNYFYIRNTLYVEKLPKDIILKLLSSSFKNNAYEVLNIVKQTYKEVIRTDNFNIQSFDIHYGPLSSTYAASNEALVIGYRNAEEDESAYEDEDAWFEDFTKRRKVVTETLNSVQNYLVKQLGSTCSVIEYFEESVKKKQTNIEKIVN